MFGTSWGEGEGYPGVWVPDVPGRSCPKSWQRLYLQTACRSLKIRSVIWLCGQQVYHSRYNAVAYVHDQQNTSASELPYLIPEVAAICSFMHAVGHAAQQREPQA